MGNYRRNSYICQAATRGGGYVSMKITGSKLRQVESDLGIGVPFIKGQVLKVNNCWHFCTDGNAVDCLFYDEDDFRDGMNRVFIVLKKYNIIILAFCLMDTHVHFILYGSFDQCNKFVHEFVRRTSEAISLKHGDRGKALNLPISHQEITDEIYLKTAICYTIKNPPYGGLPFNAWDYPWSSGSLYFRKSGLWTSPVWIIPETFERPASMMTSRERRNFLKTRRTSIISDETIIDGMVFPGDYVAYELVEQVFKSHKSFNYFMCRTKEEDIDSRGGSISMLSIPIQEMRQHRNEICLELFGKEKLQSLTAKERIVLAKTLRSRYCSSQKQVARLCGLIYEEVKSMI